MSLSINKDNYTTYKKVYEIICHYLYKELDTTLPACTNPVTLLNSWEAESTSLARRGLQAGLNDILSSYNHYPAPTIAAISAELKAHGLPNLFKLIGTIKGSVKKVLKARRIKDIDQYYIVKEFMDDTTSELTTEERNSLSIYLSDFEQATSR